MRLAVMLALAGCGGTLPGQSSPPPSNASTGSANGAPAGTPCPTTPIGAGTARIEGSAFDASKTAVMGATIIAKSAAATSELVAITDDTGHFEFPTVPAGYYDLQGYYADITVSRGCIVAADGTTANGDLVFPAAASR